MSSREQRGKERDGATNDTILNVSNLSRNVNDEHLKEIFGNYGDIKNVTIAVDKQVDLPKGYAYVEFDKRDAALEAKDMLNGGQIDGNPIKVEFILLPAGQTSPRHAASKEHPPSSKQQQQQAPEVSTNGTGTKPMEVDTKEGDKGVSPSTTKGRGVEREDKKDEERDRGRLADRDRGRGRGRDERDRDRSPPRRRERSPPPQRRRSPVRSRSPRRPPPNRRRDRSPSDSPGRGPRRRGTPPRRGAGRRGRSPSSSSSSGSSSSDSRSSSSRSVRRGRR
ncbi:unnamed protein product [Vitrella brassicaformis CCMP3155]|uniref:RRM domain-containing protein n=2 Tax=Vitrella brassicaformis TaxID=1169539 RepID=A0A0G4EIG9_VITBC|nr:unnamed protein product [Vitrella brassicaformis CCMP3155]|mmetsp:Transcript_8926/g.25709  ORF Transcript_8926/g.25709 Transcript_8926/m.25709 type:complete len:279 (-) Transcript_8926:809-1645(-)|eukprot:CEL95798.1 unnamed protein product [Vitrella brassicaformis CCMP3155]